MNKYEACAELLTRLEKDIKALLDQYESPSLCRFVNKSDLLYKLVRTAHFYGTEVARALNEEILHNLSAPALIILEKDSFEKTLYDLKEKGTK